MMSDNYVYFTEIDCWLPPDCSPPLEETVWGFRFGVLQNSPVQIFPNPYLRDLTLKAFNYQARKFGCLPACPEGNLLLIYPAAAQLLGDGVFDERSFVENMVRLWPRQSLLEIDSQKIFIWPTNGEICYMDWSKALVGCSEVISKFPNPKSYRNFISDLISSILV